jgi:hypothetical protein
MELCYWYRRHNAECPKMGSSLADMYRRHGSKSSVYNLNPHSQPPFLINKYLYVYIHKHGYTSVLQFECYSFEVTATVYCDTDKEG